MKFAYIRATIGDLVGHGLNRAVEQVRARVAEHSWRAFWQVDVEGRRAADVAQDLGMSVNAVDIAKARMLQRLRVELGHFDDDQPGSPIKMNADQK